jgi:glycosyltransferase involved in cell wall biosynthesis
VLYAFGGAIQRRVWEIARYQVQLGHEVTVYSIGERDEQREHEGVDIRYIRCAAPKPLIPYEFQLRVSTSLRRQRVDVCHFHSHPEGGLTPKTGSTKLLLTYDNFYFKRGRETALFYPYRKLLQRFDQLLPCSEYCLHESAAYWDLPETRMTVVYNGVNTTQFQPEPSLARMERERLGISDRVIIYIGRVCEQKGSHVLLAAYELLRARRQDVQLVIAGPIGQFGRTEAAADDVWLSRMRTAGAMYLGAVDEGRLSSIYKLADVFIMPTIDIEMFGMAAVEAQACGKPVVASDHAGLRETVPESAGRRFETGNAAALADNIEQLLDDDALYASCAAGALANAKQYDWSRICASLDAVYAS